MEQIAFIVKDLSISYNKFYLRNINFSLKDGDVLGIMGRSGSGKSTIIRTLVGLKKQSAGTIQLLIDGEEVPLGKYIGYSPQQNALYPYLTLAENIRIFGRLFKMRGPDIESSMEEILGSLNLSEHKDKRINQLSGGMQKRADLAVSLIHAPRLLILDEPFTGLDISLQKFIWTYLKTKLTGRIIIVSSHMISDLQKNCNQLGIVENGTLYGTEQVQEVLKKSKTQDLECYLEGLFEKAYSGGRK